MAMHRGNLSLHDATTSCQPIGSRTINTSPSSAFYKSLEWTADGTTLISASSDNHVDVVVAPVDLLEKHRQPHRLEVYLSIAASEALRAVSSYPRFDLQNASSALVLMSSRDLPIQLTSALTAQKVASYPLVSPTTEEFICPHALCFGRGGTHFITGSDSLVSVFDVSRPGQEPLAACLTGPRSRHSDNFNLATSMRGIISALDLEHSSNVLAAGTFTRKVGLYDAGGQGECTGAFSLAGNDADKEIRGQGITQLRWSKCGRFLYVAERKSDGVMVYDIRMTGQLLSWLQERQAFTNQRLSFDLAEGEDGVQQVWAGGVDGSVRRWDSPQHNEGGISPAWEMRAGRESVSSATVHRTGSVLATCSGSRPLSSEEGTARSTGEDDSYVSGINIWELPN